MCRAQRRQLIDDVVVYNLDKDSKYMYDMIMNQPENDTIPIKFGAEAFGYPGRVILVVQDVMKLFNNENISIIQIFCL
jgi:hypothetical protein